MDRGFASTANISHMHEEHLSYVLGVESRYKAARQAVEEVRDQICLMRHRLPGGVYARRVKGRFWGQVGTLHVFYDPVLAERRRAELERRAQDKADQLTQLAQLTKQQAKGYRAYFDIVLGDNESFTFTWDWDKIDAAAKDAGFFTILTDTDLTSAEVLDIYRRKDVIEKGFDELKNHVDMKRLRTHSDATTAGKLFCAFIALIAVCHIQAKVGPMLKTTKRSLSKKDVLAEMDKIKVVDAASGRRLINPATKTQRDILEALGLTETDLKTYATPR
jgi:transposase